MELTQKACESRRTKHRFPMQRDLHYKMTEDGVQTAAGSGTTLAIGSGGVALTADQAMRVGAFVELSISWPMLLDECLPIRLIVFGRVLQVSGQRAECSLEKYEFRTQARKVTTIPCGVRSDSMLQRWLDEVQKEAKPHPHLARF